MTNHRQTRTGFAYARLWRSAACMVTCISCLAIARLIASPSYVMLVTDGEKDIGYIGENGEFVPFEKNKDSIDASQNIQSRPRYTATTPQIQPQQPRPAAQFQNYSDVVTASQVDSKMPHTLNERQLKGNTLDSHGNQVGRNVGPNEAIFVNENAKIQDTQGGDDVVKKSGDAIGVVRPSGESHGFGDGKKEVVPQRANQNINEVGNNPALRQPQKQSNADQSQNTRTVSMTQRLDGSFTDGTKTYTLDDKGCLIDAESGEKTHYYIPGSKCEKEICTAQEPISTKEANRIAYGKISEFYKFAPTELALVIERSGGIESYSWGTSDEVNFKYSQDSFVHIHSHPFDEGNCFSGWPSHGDIVAMFRKDNWLSQFLMEKGCSQARKFYNYIVYFDDGTHDFDRRLIRYDEDGVYNVMNENGEEKVIDMSDKMKEAVNKQWETTLKENVEILNGELNYSEIGHRPFNFNDSMEMEFAKREAKKQNSGATANGSMLTVMKKTAKDSKDVKKALEEFHKKFLAMPNSQFKWQQIQAYLDLVVSLQSWTLPPEKVLNKLVQEGAIIRTRNNTWKDLVEAPLASDDSKSCWAKEKIGIRGWCRCGTFHHTPQHEHELLGVSVVGKAVDGRREQYDAVGLLAFIVCKQCGKCCKEISMGGCGDVRFYVEPYAEAVDAYISQTFKQVAARKKMEDAILSIPDGEIVFPIKRICQCKHSRDKKPNIFAFYERQGSQEMLRRYICADCSGLYSPNNTCNSTAK